MRKTGFTLVSVLCIPLGVLAACGSGHSPRAQSASSTPAGAASWVSTSPAPVVPTTGPNVRPGERPPVLSAAAKVNTPRGAVRFAKYWFEALDWGYATTSSALARQLYSSACVDCERFVSHMIDSTSAANEHFSGGRITVLATTVQDVDSRGATAVVEVTAKQSALKVLNASGGSVESDPPIAPETFRTSLAWSSASWKVIGWKREIRK